MPVLVLFDVSFEVLILFSTALWQLCSIVATAPIESSVRIEKEEKR